jgi:hypothetical protein
MKKNPSTADAQSFDTEMRVIDRQIRKQDLEDITAPDETLAGRLGHALVIFGTIRPLLVFIAPVRRAGGDA